MILLPLFIVAYVVISAFVALFLNWWAGDPNDGPREHAVYIVFAVMWPTLLTFWILAIILDGAGKLAQWIVGEDK